MKLVLIEWHDSRQPESGWTWLEQSEQPAIVRCRSVGWLAKEDEDGLMLVPNLGDDGQQGCGGIVIARRQVVNVIEITDPSSVPVSLEQLA